MAKSLAHKWGQIIGNVFQECVQGVLQECANRHGLYLDSHRKRRARKGKSKVSWRDRFGNSHDLDYVFEKAGSEDNFGAPVAFVEAAWRSYAKHAKNKVQEIEGAVSPLTETYSNVHPFTAAILAGAFTKPSLEQLRSRGFVVVFFPPSTVFQAFATAGLDASFSESTKENEFREKIKQFEGLSPAQTKRIQETLFNTRDVQVRAFVQSLDASFLRQVESVTVVALHGKLKELHTIKEAVAYVDSYKNRIPTRAPALKYEIQVRFNNGDSILGVFHHKVAAVDFLNSYAVIPEAKPVA